MNGAACEAYMFNASSIDVITGTLDAGNLASTYTLDGDWYNVSEINEMPGLDIRVNFTGICEDMVCGCLDVYHKYVGHSQHEVLIQFYNFTTDTWITNGAFIYNETAGLVCIGIGHSADHLVNNGTLWARFYHESQGHIKHELHVDEIELSVACGEECPIITVPSLFPGLAIGISLFIIAAAYYYYQRR
ncbi:hypothetical protein ES703_48211 [subsurface metagenome]